MAFTYGEDLSVDRDYVRFHTGDTVSDESFLSDAIITSLIAVAGSKQRAVIQAIQYIISQLSKPNFKADWLQIDNATARAGYETLLREKRRELGIAAVSSTVHHAYRADSSQVEEPDYSNGTAGDDDEYIVIYVGNPE